MITLHVCIKGKISCTGIWKVSSLLDQELAQQPLIPYAPPTALPVAKSTWETSPGHLAWFTNLFLRFSSN